MTPDYLVAMGLAQLARPMVDSLFSVHDAAHRRTRHTNRESAEVASRLRLEEWHRIRWEERSPFVAGDEEARRLIEEECTRADCPIVLVAPYYDELQKANDQAERVGGFRAAITNGLVHAQWAHRYRVLDGFLRPLTFGDLDLIRIRQVLDGLPVVVLWGVVKVGDEIVSGARMWNISRHGSEHSVLGQAVPRPRDPTLADYDAGMTAHRDFHRRLGQDMALVAGIAADWYALCWRKEAPVVPGLIEEAGEHGVALALAAATGGVRAEDLSLPERILGLRALGTRHTRSDVRRALAALAEGVRASIDPVTIEAAHDVADLAVDVLAADGEGSALVAAWTAFGLAVAALRLRPETDRELRRAFEGYVEAAARGSLAEVAATCSGEMGATVVDALQVVDAWEHRMAAVWLAHGLPSGLLDPVAIEAASLAAAARHAEPDDTVSRCAG